MRGKRSKGEGRRWELRALQAVVLAAGERGRHLRGEGRHLRTHLPESPRRVSPDIKEAVREEGGDLRRYYPLSDDARGEFEAWKKDRD